jgi:hypothetical protein
VRAKENIVQPNTNPTQSGERVSQGDNGRMKKALAKVIGDSMINNPGREFSLTAEQFGSCELE